MSLEKVSAFMQALGVAYFFWMGYQAPTSQQSTKDFLVAAFLGISLILLLVRLFRHTESREPSAEKDHGTEDDNTDFRQLFLDEQFSREKYQDQFVKAREERDQLKNEVDQLKAQKPDTSVKDHDPQLEIKVTDLRGRIISDDPKEQACFDLINRGKQSSAIFACIEDFKIGGYLVAFRHFPPPIAAFGNHESVTPHYINRPDGTLSTNHLFTVFSAAWSDLKNPKLYEYVVQIKATYQDEGRNLFEVRCDLVFYPFEHANRLVGQPAGTVLETKNHRIRKIAPAFHPINWES